MRVQRHLLEKKDINLKSALEEAQACELSNKSMAEIRKSNHNQRPLSADQPLSIMKRWTHDEGDDKDEVSHLKMSQTKKWPSEKTMSLSSCLGCGENNPRLSCHLKLSSASDAARKATWHGFAGPTYK